MHTICLLSQVMVNQIAATSQSAQHMGQFYGQRQKSYKGELHE